MMRVLTGREELALRKLQFDRLKEDSLFTTQVVPDAPVAGVISHKSFLCLGRADDNSVFVIELDGYNKLLIRTGAMPVVTKLFFDDMACINIIE